MQNIPISSLIVILTASLASPSAAHDVGDTAVFIEKSAVRQRDEPDRPVGMGEIVTIERVEDGWLRVRGTASGWVKPGVVMSPENAVAHFSDILNDAPDSPAVHLARGNVRQHLAEHVEAIEDFTKVIETKPDWDTAYYNRGNSYYALGEFDKAIKDFDESLKRRPDDAWAYNNRGLCWYAKGEHQRAVDDFTAALLLAPNEALIFKNRGWAYHKLKEAEKSADDFKSALRIRHGGVAPRRTAATANPLENPAAPAAPRRQLRGKWKVTSTTLNGRKFDHLLGGRATFTDDRLKLKVKKFGELEFRYKIDATKTPAQLSVSRGQGLAPLPPELDFLARHIAGAARTTTYSVDGDRLKANITLAGLPVPQEIKDRLGAAVNGGQLVIEMQRDTGERGTSVP